MTHDPASIDPQIGYLQLKIALADSITQWAQIEDSLAWLVRVAIHSPFDCAFGIYFAPAAAETRFAIVDAVMKAFTQGNKVIPDLHLLWVRTLQLLNKARKSRNKLAHGSISGHRRDDDIPHPRLTDTMTQTYLMKSDEELRQLPGMSLHDVQAIYSKFVVCTKNVQDLSVLASLSKREQVPVPTLHEAYQQLRVRLNLTPAQSGDPTPPEF